MKSKKLLCKLLIGVLAACTLLSSCDKTPADPQGTQGGTESESVTQELPADWYTAETPGVVDLSEYTIIRPEESSQELIKAAAQLRGYINSTCGLDISVKSDSTTAKGKEILVGKTNRPASLAAYENAKEKNWSVSVVEDNIVLMAGVDGTINLATTWIQNNTLQKGNKYAKIGEGASFAYNYPITTLKVGETSVSDMSIAYLDADNVGYVDAAYMLAYDILDRYGEPLSVVPYSAANASKQILVASYKQAQKYLDGVDAPEIAEESMEYAIVNNNGGIMILAGDSVGADMGVQTLINACKASTDGTADWATLCSNQKKTVVVGTDTLAKMDGAEYRIMSFNVWRINWEGFSGGVDPNKSTRLEAAKNTMLYYAPDVVGFQEYCQGWTQEYTTWLTANGYTVVGNDKVTEQDNAETFYREDQNYTPIAFKTDKFDLVASGWVRLDDTYEVGAEGDLGYYPGHNITWVVLKDKVTQEQFAVTSTHFFHGGGSTAEVANATRTKGAEQLVALANKLKTDYSCAVICVGDYNSTEATDCNKTITASLKDARYIATSEYSSALGYHENGEVDVTYGAEYAIDHAFVTDGVGVIRHKLGISQMTADAADHFPMFIDITID